MNDIYTCCYTNDVIEYLHNGTLVCQNCGKVVEENMQLPCYTDECEHDENTLDEDYSHIYFQPTTRMQYYVMKNCIPSKQKGRERMNSIIDDMCEGMTSQVQNEVKNLYRTMNENNIFRGKILRGMVSCCIMNACKNLGEEKTVNDISLITKVDTTVINKCNKIFLKIMKNDCQNGNNDVENTTFLIRTSVNKLTFLSRKQRMAIIPYVETGLRKYTHVFDGKKKKSKIVSLIIYYLASNYGKGSYKKEICDKLDVTVVTVNKMLKELRTFDDR